MPRDGERNIGYLVNQSARLLTKQLNARLKELDLTQSQYALIRSVDAIKDRPATEAVVVEDLRTDAAALARAVEQAVAHGWLTATSHPELARELVLELTPKARSVLPALVDAGRWTTESGLNGFTRDEVLALKGYLQRLVRNLEQADV